MEYYICVEPNIAKLENTTGCSEFFLKPSGKKAVEEEITKYMFICVFGKFMRNGRSNQAMAFNQLKYNVLLAEISAFLFATAYLQLF